MNSGQINGFGVNGPAYAGANATLTGGLASGVLFAAAMMASSVLTGGIETANDAGGRVSRAISGGAYSDSKVDGKWLYTANLQGGIYLSGCVDAGLCIASGFGGGVLSPSGFGGVLLCNARLQSEDTVGDTSVAGGYMSSGSRLSGGAASNAWASAQIIGGTMLVSGGVFSGCELVGAFYNGIQMGGRIESSNSIGGHCLVTARLQSGIASHSSTGNGLQIGANLYDGLIQVGVVDSPFMRLSAELGGGVGSSANFNAQIRISSYGADGVESTEQMGANLRKDEKLLGGIQVGCFLDSVALRAAQNLLGGLSSSGVAGSVQTIGACLYSGASSTAFAYSIQRIGLRLQGGAFTTGLIGSGYIIYSSLNGGTATACAAGGFLKSSGNFQGGIDSHSGFSASLKYSPALQGGVYSGISTGGNIAQGFKDPMLNTWALSIRSATPILSIQTPLQDI